MINTERQLIEVLQGNNYDAIVVEGYDGVGKGKVLSILSELYGVTPYRPDYNLWQKYDLRPEDRWKISGFFWDIFSHFNRYNLPLATPMLFDRGVLSGAVYTDYRIASDYRYLLRGRYVLHILVTCDEESYYKFAEVRGKYGASYQEYQKYTQKYKDAIKDSGVEFLIYENHYDENEAEKLAKTCEGCGHYNYGYCRHPLLNMRVDGSTIRCGYSTDSEVQDIDTEMHVM